MAEKVRIDKWLFAVRLYKTRSLAAEACEKGKVKIGNMVVKASRTIKINEIIVLHRGPWHQTIKVIQLQEKRMGAAMVKDFCIDITPNEELERLKSHQAALASWDLNLDQVDLQKRIVGIWMIIWVIGK